MKKPLPQLFCFAARVTRLSAIKQRSRWLAVEAQQRRKYESHEFLAPILIGKFETVTKFALVEPRLKCATPLYRRERPPPDPGDKLEAV
jgi:hypothetical protein